MLSPLADPGQEPDNLLWSYPMITRPRFSVATSALLLAAMLAATGCAVSRGQETMGAYVDDTTITTRVKTRMLEHKDVAGTSISVETLNGTVMLSGFAKSALERSTAEDLARTTSGVRTVRNEIAIRP
jgi:hyperosmotically inducible protein